MSGCEAPSSAALTSVAVRADVSSRALLERRALKLHSVG